MELNEAEKRQLFQIDGDCQAKVLDELYMTARFTRNPEQRDMVRGLMAKLRVLSDEQCMDLVKDIQKNYHLPYPRTMGERIALARQQSGAEKLKGHDIMALERFDPEGWPISVKTGWIRSAAQSRNWKSRGILPGTGSVTRMAGWAILSTSSMRSLCFPMDMILFCHLNGKIQDR